MLGDILTDCNSRPTLTKLDDFGKTNQYLYQNFPSKVSRTKLICFNLIGLRAKDMEKEGSEQAW